MVGRPFPQSEASPHFFASLGTGTLHAPRVDRVLVRIRGGEDNFASVQIPHYEHVHPGGCLGLSGLTSPGSHPCEGDILSGDEGDILSGDEGDILSGDDGDILSDGSVISEEGGSVTAAADEEGQKVTAAMPEPDAELWAALGGWYRSDFVLYYKPLGHADPFIRAWLDFSGRTFGTPQQPKGAALFTALADERSPGRCTKCHSVDHEADGVMNTKWSPRMPRQGTKAATVFSHATHFSMLNEEGCLTCHALGTAANYADGYKDYDPFTFSSNFASIDLATCATCHVEERAGDSCLLCH